MPSTMATHDKQQWVVTHDPHDYNYPDVYGPFEGRVEAEAFIELYLVNNPGLDRDDFTEQQMLKPEDYA